MASAIKKSLHAAEQERPDVREARQAWLKLQKQLDPAKLIFIDETGAATNMTRRYGRAPYDQRLVCSVPHGHWKTTTFVAGLRQTGITAPFVIDRPMNADIFTTYIAKVLCPTLTAGDIVIMDNLSSHKGENIRRLIEEKGANLLFLPPYSPDFNPIEQAFSKLKAMLRKAAKRTVDALWEAIGSILDLFSAQECSNYFTNAGYEPN